MFLRKIIKFLLAALFFTVMISPVEKGDLLSVILFVVLSVFISGRLTAPYLLSIKFSALHAFVYMFWLFVEVIKSSIQVIKVILNFQPYEPVFEKIKLAEVDDIAIAYADSITLTPGTTSIDLKSDVLFVHCLNKDFAKSLSDDNMLKKIKGVKSD